MAKGPYRDILDGKVLTLRAGAGVLLRNGLRLAGAEA